MIFRHGGLMRAGNNLLVVIKYRLTMLDRFEQYRGLGNYFVNG